MNKECISIPPKDINSQEYWDEILAKEGMPSKLPPLKNATSLEREKNRILSIQEGIDQAVVTENIYSSEIPLNKSGLPPCQRAKAEISRGITPDSSKLRNN